MRRKIRHGATVQCDVPGCPQTFTTYSIASIARIQACIAGWARLKLGSMPGWEAFELGSSKRKKIDVCPNHIPRPRMEGAHP